AAAVVVVALGAWWVLRGHDARRAPDLAAQLVATTQWVAPTDFLLETPGRDLLRGVPGFKLWRNQS
ncbi:MAG: hypothetical protein ACREMV_09880, partial [Gemmatimonadales bacterium]